MPPLVFDELRVALSIDRCEIDSDRRTVPVLRESRPRELVFRLVSREQKRQRFGFPGIRVGAAVATLPVFVAWHATVDFPNFANHLCAAGNVTAFGFDAQFGFDRPGEPQRRITEIDRLHPGRFETDHTLCTVVELRDLLTNP